MSSAFFHELQEYLLSLDLHPPVVPGRDREEYCYEIQQAKGRSLTIFPKAIFDPPKSQDNDLPGVFKREGDIILWEDQWQSKPKIVKSRIEALLGISIRIPARLTEVRSLDRPTTLQFLQKNHLQDAVLSKHKYGLYLPRKHFRVLADPPEVDELLVAVATFARPRIFEREGEPHRSYELVRFANRLNTTVVGGLDKLLSHFVREHQPDDLMTYADLEWSSGRSYRKLGFAPQGDTPPQEFWVDPAAMERYYPHRLPNGITSDNAPKLGFVKIANAGSRKFVKNFNP